MQPEEYYGFINGKIDYNIPRLTSELVKKDFVSYLEAADRAFPGIEYFCIGQPDGWINLHYKDKAAGWDRLAERGPRGRFSDYAWKFNMDIRKRLMKKYPDRKLSIFAYSNTRRIPASVDKVPENVTIGFCQTANGWMEPTNTELRDRNEWLEKMSHKNQLFIWEYYLTHASYRNFPPVPAIFSKLMHKSFKGL
ncbi:MAG: DUF4838 domain-containing protein, partial [Planctomycetota bacterium]